MGAFYKPQREFARWDVRDPDMSGMGAGHVRQPSLEFGLGIGHLWYRALTRDKIERPDMSGLGAGHV
jgi:hypothetical protein